MAVKIRGEPEQSRTAGGDGISPGKEQMILGLSRPAAQVPRTVELPSLLGTALAVGVEAIKYHELYPDGEV